MAETNGMIYEFGPFRLEVNERRLLCRGRAVPMRPKVFDTLEALVTRHGHLVRKEELMEWIWPATAVEENNLALNVAVLRKALGELAPGEKLIETVTGKGYRFVAQVRAYGECPPPAAAEPAGGSAALLERGHEMSVLREALREALRGRLQVVCICGEAGIGKTALLEVFLAEVSARHPEVLVARGQCVEHSGEDEPYMPVLEALARLSRGPRGAEITGLLRRHAPAWLLQLPSLVEPGGNDELVQRSLGATSQRMLREFGEVVEALADLAPLVLALEDLHWADVSTRDLLAALGRRQGRARLLFAGTYRTGETAVAVETLGKELQLRGQGRLLRPGPLSRDATQQLVRDRLPGEDVPPGLAETIHRRSGGNPLFAQALADYWSLDRDGSLMERGIPDNLRAMLQRKIGAVPADRDLLECAAVAGVSFSADLVAAALGKDEDEIERQCAELAARGALFQDAGAAARPGGGVSARFAFAHALYQEVLYEQTPAGRRARLHRRIAERLEQGRGDAAESQAAAIAYHFEAAREAGRAVPYLHAAAQGALRRSAHREAAAYLRRALAALATLPPSPENRAREFDVLSLLAPTLTAIEGFFSSDAERCFGRARELGRELGLTNRLHPVLYGLAMMHELRGEYPVTEEILNDRLRLPRPEDQTSVLVDSDALMACSMFHQGRFSSALEVADRGIRLYDPGKHLAILAAYGENPGVSCHGWAGLSLWFLGYPARALERARNAVALSEHPGHLFSLCSAKASVAHVYQLRREPELAGEWAEAALRLAEAQGYLLYVAFAQVVKGWVEVETGFPDGIARIEDGLATAGRIGARLDLPYLLALSAEARGRLGQWDAAMDALAEAMALVRHSRAFFYEAELLRLRAGLRRETRQDGAEADLRAALALAAKQGARSLELRSAADLCEWLAATGRAAEGSRLLSPLLQSFPEQDGGADWTRAEALLARVC